MHIPARIIAFLILVTGLMGCAANVDAPRVQRGVLDLSAWDFAEHGPVALRGEWEFAWMESYDPGALPWDGQAPVRDFLTLPGLWQGETQAGVRLSPHGYGFYRLRIRISPDPDPMSLLVSAPLSVCRVWVDGLVVGETGTPGEDAESEKPVSHMLMARFVPAGEVTEVVLQVSNFHNLQGGLNATIYLGTEKRITQLVLTRWILGAFVGGSLLALCVYHLTLFVLRRRERANLFFALFCLMWTTAIAFSPSYAFPLPHVISLPWSWGVTLSLLPFGLIIPLMTIFYHELFPKRFGKWVNMVYLLLGAGYMVYLLATPPNAYDAVPFLYFLITRTVFVYLIGAFIVDVVNREQGVLLLVPGYLALGAAEFDDILFDLNLVGSTDLAPLGVFIFICCYSFFMSLRHSQTRDSVARLSAELETAGERISQLRAMEQVHAPPRRETTPQPADKRLLAVRVMNLAVDCWIACTRTSKADLARQSGLWNVYMEKDGYCRTQTMDKYLSQGTLPLRPRWLKIQATAEFVLATCQEGAPLRLELEKALGELKAVV